MIRSLSALFLVSLCVCTLKVYASRLKYPVFHEDNLSSSEHYEDDTHNAEYDHEAFLGQQQAQEWEKLPVDEVKQKLRQVIPLFYNLKIYFCAPVYVLCANGSMECIKK